MRKRPAHRTDLTVWLDPGTAAASPELLAVLRGAYRLVVVPRTGTRQADAAVLVDPSPGTLLRVAAALPGTVLVALLSEPSSSAQRIAAVRVGARLLPAAAPPAQLLAALRGRPAPVREPALT